MNFLNSFVDKGLIERLKFVARQPSSSAVSYTEAIEILDQLQRQI